MPTALDDFESLDTIGTGSYGICKKIRRKKDGKVLVWKEMDYGFMTEAEKQMLVSEVNLLRELRHQHIVRYYDRIIDRGKTKIYIIMEYCEGGDLATLIANNKKQGTHVGEDFAWKILIQMTLALQDCHRRKNGRAVLHRDLKPANIFLDVNQNVKLGDFGLARVLHHDTSFANTYVGTPYYMSPELVNNMSYNEKCDIWSMGCMLYELCALHPPFVAPNQMELNRKIRSGMFPRLPSQYSNELDQMIRKLIVVQVVKRPSIDQVLNDPLLVNRRLKLERRSSCDPTSENILKYRHELEEEFRVRQKVLDLREKELESRERSVALLEKAAEEKYKRVTDLLQQVKKRNVIVNDENRQSPRSPSQLDSPPPCLSRGERDVDSPKKRVSFDINGKENLRTKSRYSDCLPLDYKHFGDDLYSKELARRQELKDRLFEVKTKALEYHGLDLKTKYRCKNGGILNFR
ncbi:serine/threonine-protein kinase Nek2-like isoform X2 [Gigantopelta aegis]|nr:serine/threonine-protein kinase Nek2-like isoform X2 [Gigantopelta aegis]